MVYCKCYLVNPHVQTTQNMYGKGGWRVCKAELWLLKVDPYFKREKNMFSGVRQNYLATKFNTKAKSSSDGVRNVYKKILSRGFYSKVKILAK